MAKNEVLPNVAFIPTGREHIPADPRVDKLIENLTGCKKTGDALVRWLVIETDHYPNSQTKLLGTFSLLSEYNDRSPKVIFYNPEGTLPTNGLHTPKPIFETLREFMEAGFEFRVVTPIDTLYFKMPGQRGLRRTYVNPLENVRLNAKNYFQNETGIPSDFAFRVEKPRVALDQIAQGVEIDIAPLPDDIRVLRPDWYRTGLVQELTHPGPMHLTVLRAA